MPKCQTKTWCIVWASERSGGIEVHKSLCHGIVFTQPNIYGGTRDDPTGICWETRDYVINVLLIICSIINCSYFEFSHLFFSTLFFMFHFSFICLINFLFILLGSFFFHNNSSYILIYCLIKIIIPNYQIFSSSFYYLSIYNWNKYKK